MSKPLTSKALSKALLERLELSMPLQGLDSHSSATDLEAIDTSIGDDCVLRIRASAFGPTSKRSYSASLAVAHLSTELDYDDLWSVKNRSDGDRYFPLACGVSELTDVPQAGLPADDIAVDLLAKRLGEAVSKHVWPIRTCAAAAGELIRGPSSPWYSLLAYQNWLPVALLVDQGPRPAYALARQVLAQQESDESARTVAYRRFVEKLKKRTEL